MKIQAINNTYARNYSKVDFSGNKKDNSQSGVTDVIRSKAVAVPVVVLLAANPATLNSAIPAKPLEGAKIAAVQSSEVSKADGATFTDFPAVQETQQSSAPYGFAYLRGYKIRKTMPIQTVFGPAELIFADDGSDSKENRYKVNDPKRVTNIFVNFKNMKKCPNPNINPPTLNEFKLFKDNNGKDCYIADVSLDFWQEGKEWPVGGAIFRLKLDDNTAKELINFYKNKSDLHNDWGGKKYKDKFSDWSCWPWEHINEELTGNPFSELYIDGKNKEIDLSREDLKRLLNGENYGDYLARQEAAKPLPEQTSTVTQVQPYPYGWAALNSTYRIKGKIPVNTDFGPGVILLTTLKKNEYKYPKDFKDNTFYSDVFLILNNEETPTGKPITNPDIDPIRIRIFYHPGEDNDNCYKVFAMIPKVTDDNKYEDLFGRDIKLDKKGGEELDCALRGYTSFYYPVSDKSASIPKHKMTAEEKKALEMYIAAKTTELILGKKL